MEATVKMRKKMHGAGKDALTQAELDTIHKEEERAQELESPARMHIQAYLENKHNNKLSHH